jgi:hypothetical protein
LSVALLVGVCFLTDAAVAGDYYSSVPFLPTVKIGPDSEGATEAGTVYGKEYSHTDWFSVYHGLFDPNLVNAEDHDAFAVADPLQVVSWDGQAGPIGGNSGSVDAFDFGVPGFSFLEGQVDALANRQDFLFRQIVRNEATLLFSVTADINASSVLPLAGSGSSAGIVAKAHVHFEDPVGPDALSPFDTWALIEAPPAGPGPGPGVNHHVVEDLDALEVWGPEPPSHSNPDNPTPVREGYIGGFPGANTADADRFSLDLDAASGTSVWAYSIAGGIVSSYIPHSEIVAAIEELFLGEGFRFDDETRRAIDVDGTMVRDVGDVPDTAPALWDSGDELLFTIDPISGGLVLDASGAVVGAAPLIDGGEIMQLVKTAPGLGAGTFAISFLSHGGHLWDTAFDVSGTFGYYFEDVDALEAVGTLTGDTDIDTPEPATLGLLLLGGLALLVRRRST